jgi:hypothetical protein
MENRIMKKTLSALALLGACVTLGLPHAWAEDSSAKPKKTAKKHHAKASTKKKAAATAKAAPPASSSDDDKTVDTASATAVDYQCALGDKITIYQPATDDKHIGLNWHKQVHTLTRVDTTTGANRFENHKAGLVWIGIPAKGMLLDSKKGQQLANDCKNTEQMNAKPAEASPGLLTSEAPKTEAPKH